MTEQSKNMFSGKNITEMLRGADLSAFRPVVFWSVNSCLQEDELRRQLREMKSYGLGGVVFHARAGMTTEYLSEEWFRMVGVSLREAASLGMRVWMYDEFGWPSGFVGGRLLAERENRARYLEYAVKDSFDAAAYAVYSLDGGAPRLLSPGERAEKYHTLYLRYSDAYADILNPDVTDQFIAATYEPYYERFAASFGKELIGFFTDEPQYYRYATPVSKVTEAEYARQYGEDLKSGLIYLFLADERGYPFRVRYYNLMNRLYCENYYKKLYDWCSAHGCMLTGHSVEETFFFTQMWGGADCATSYLHEHIPAIDNLAKYSPASISAKNVGSVAAQTGKNLVMTETFGCSSYGVTPRELRLIGDKQYVFGVDLMCQHLYNYSLAGQGKIDHPVSFGRTLPWIGGYKTMNDYFAALGYLIASSREEAQVAVVTPMESVYLDYIRLHEDAARENVDIGFAEIAAQLKKRGVAYHFVNEKVLEKLGGVQGGRLTVGGRAYSAVLLANCRELKGNTVRLLGQFLAEGGKLAAAGAQPMYADGVRADLSSVRANITLAELPVPGAVRDAALDYTLRTLPGGKRFFFGVNESDHSVRVELNGSFSQIDAETLEGYAPQSVFEVPPHGSLLAEENGDYSLIPVRAEHMREIVPEFYSAGQNCLTIENVSVGLENGEVLNGYLYGVYETLVKRGYRGKIHVSFSFRSDAARSIRLTAEKQEVRNERFNGEPILSFAQSEEDINFKTARLQARRGENVYEYDAELTDAAQVRSVLFEAGVPESLRNCFSYSTYMEQIYIEGEFDVKNGELVAARPKTAGNLTAQGMENFCGCAEYTFTAKAEGRVRLRPVGKFAMCEIFCEGKRAAVLLGDSAEMELGAGTHIFTVRCTSTMRNRYGAFHCVRDEGQGVSPDCFTLRGKWTDEHTNPDYTAERKTEPFGLYSVILTY